MAVPTGVLVDRVTDYIGELGSAHELLSPPSAGWSELKLSRGGLLVANCSNFDRKADGERPEATYNPGLIAIKHLFGEESSLTLSKNSGTYLLIPSESLDWEGRFVPVTESTDNARTDVPTYYLPLSRPMEEADVTKAEDLLDAFRAVRTECIAFAVQDAQTEK